ncbi:hypothetical protein HYALB_00012632 [Hymenoscyphus albidus]|uniref:Uncharacterized protein n=1 Tax=Hymenoscyphus albidus TaxID=595503 RepID=A0A9N9LS06_9HELO|nr:hypothetical protein HYALB_00012632 [Hymenoscyphus albidus]
MNSSPRYPGEGLEVDTTPNEKYPYHETHDTAPQVVQPEKQHSGMSEYSQPSPFQEEKAVDPKVKPKGVFGLRRRTFWIILGSLGVALVVALIVVIGVLSHQLSQDKSSNEAAVSSASAAAQNPNQITYSLTSIPPSTLTPSARLPESTLTPIVRPSTSSPTQASNSPPTSTSTSTCPSNAVIGKCDAPGCNGLNSQTASLGSCTTSDLRGCPCQTLCGVILGPCGNCDGVNGTCYGGPFQGCGCT